MMTTSTNTRLGPRSVERSADAGWTLVAGLDDPCPARVDGGGLVAPAGAEWVLDWWVGADDRWYLPAREPSVRQRRVGAGPVIETAVRVPSGDVVATAYPVLAAGAGSAGSAGSMGGGRATAVEFRNDSPVPVVLALAVRPFDLDGSPRSLSGLELADGRVLMIDGEPRVVLPRRPNEAGASADRDQLDEVQAGRSLRWDGPVAGPGANAVCLFPLPHGTSLRVFVLGPPVVGSRPGTSSPGPSPSDPVTPFDTGPFDTGPAPDVVARGWSSVVERAATFRFPDPGLTSLADAARARLILTAPSLPGRIDTIDRETADVLEALALAGHGDECLPAIEVLSRSFLTRLPGGRGAGSGAEAAASTVRAAAAGAELFPPEVAETLLESMTQLTSLVERSAGRSDPGAATAVAQRALARLALRAGQPDAAHHLRSLAAATDWPADSLDRPPGPAARADRAAGEASGGDRALERVTALAQQARPAGSWPVADEPRPAARFWTRVRHLLVAGEPNPDGGDVRLLPAMPSAWMGGEVEVHRAPAAGARVSFAIRWHGYRPALLWQVEPAHPDHPAPSLRLTCPGLDPDWSSAEPSGEALLAGSPERLPPAPAPGESFT